MRETTREKTQSGMHWCAVKKQPEIIQNTGNGDTLDGRATPRHTPFSKHAQHTSRQVDFHTQPCSPGSKRDTRQPHALLATETGR